jgi:hypothetical protein
VPGPGFQRKIVAAPQGGIFFAQGEQFFGEVEERMRVGLLGEHVAVEEIRIYRQPGPGSGKAGLHTIIPLHRGAAAVAALCKWASSVFGRAGRGSHFGVRVISRMPISSP